MAPFKADSAYTFKAVPKGPAAQALRAVEVTREVADPATPVERRIYEHTTRGHLLFFAGRYQPALQEYLAAWGLLPRIVEPWLPELVATVVPQLIFEIDLTDSLIEAIPEIIKVRGQGVTDPVPELAIAEVPDRLVEVAAKYGSVGSSEPFDAGRSLYRRGLSLVREGRLDAGLEMLQAATERAEHPQLRAAAQMAQGVALARGGDTDQAVQSLQRSLKLAARLADEELAGAVHNNLAIVHGLAGDGARAGEHLREAAGSVPLGLDRSVVDRLNPGLAAEVVRPMGAVAERFILAAAAEGRGWTTIGAKAERAPERVGVLKGGEALTVALDANAAAFVREQVYEARVGATALAELATFEAVSITQFVTYLTHVWGYVLPVAIGDTYHELGSHDTALTWYLKARDYRYLNQAIEVPSLWRRCARSELDAAELLYKARDMAGARTRLERILRLQDGGPVLSGPLYEGGFAPMQARVLAFLNAADPVGSTDLSHEIRAILLEARIDLTRILAGINWFGFPEDLIPIHTFEYLQNVARYFADTAIQAERSFIQFKARSEEEQATRRLLEDAVAVEEANLALEHRRVEASRDQVAAAEANADLAQLRIDQANATLADFDNLSWQLQELDASLALANAAANTTEVVVTPGRAAELGVEPGTYEARYYVKLLTQRRHQVNRILERANLVRRRDETIAAKAVADAQVVAANSMLGVAEAQVTLSEVRLDGARSRLEAFEDEVFTPELWDNLARELRDLSRQYLRWAIGAAFLMERAFEFEHDREVDVIRFDYDRSDLQNLLAADFLKRDIDSFAYERLLETEKKIPMKEVISLSERYPYQFYQEFQRTGRIDFETALLDFDRRYPGSYLQKIRRVEVVIDGLVPPEGLHGTLTNSGVSHYRDRLGQRRTRLQKPETLLISRFAARDDSLLIPPTGQTLQLFENTGVATGWVLEVPPAANDVDYRSIVDVKLVIAYEAFYSEAVAAVVAGELAALPDTYSIGFAIALEFPEAFFELQDTGEVPFSLTEGDLPRTQTAPTITNVTLVVQVDPGATAAGLELTIERSGGASATDTTDANGQVAADPGAAAALNALLGQSLLGDWRVAVDGSALPAGTTLADVHDIFLWVEYDFTRRAL
jgi:hypothetical protein